jgi:uncharacterized membrane protein
MELMNYDEIFWIFLIYSFLGWLAETMLTIIRKKKFLNRGILSGPICIIYGFSAVIITLGFGELHKSYLFLFLGTALISTVMEWIGSHILEKTGHARWWNYEGKKWNLNGYICLQYTLLWGVLGVIGLKFGNPVFLHLYGLIPVLLRKIILWVLMVLVLLDGIGSFAVAAGIQDKFPNTERLSHQITKQTIRFGNWLANVINRRLKKAYPGRQPVEKVVKPANVFARGVGFYKLVWLFFIGSFLGDIIETIFCRITADVWMSRTSVVWGNFSIVWGLAIVFATVLLQNLQHKADGFIFLAGTLLGGVYEYLCSVFTQLVFGQVFWDYSKLPFNLGGRINLLYCFFWGIVAVIWLKKIYPFLSRFIEKLPIMFGKIFVWVFLLFMVCNISLTGLALWRYTERQEGIAANDSVDHWMDEHYPDAKMARIFPNAKSAIGQSGSTGN